MSKLSKTKTYAGFNYEIHLDGVVLWEVSNDGAKEKVPHHRFMSEDQGSGKAKKVALPSDKLVEEFIDMYNESLQYLTQHQAKVSNHKDFKYKKGDYILHTLQASNIKKTPNITLYQVKSTSKSEYGNCYNLKPMRVISGSDRDNSIYSPFCHVVDSWASFEKVEGDRLLQLLKMGKEI